MYNTVKFWAKNAPSNASISIEVLLSEGSSSVENTIHDAETVLKSWGVSPSNFNVGVVSFDDIWNDQD